MHSKWSKSSTYGCSSDQSGSPSLPCIPRDFKGEENKRDSVTEGGCFLNVNVPLQMPAELAAQVLGTPRYLVTPVCLAPQLSVGFSFRRILPRSQHFRRNADIPRDEHLVNSAWFRLVLGTWSLAYDSGNKRRKKKEAEATESRQGARFAFLPRNSHPTSGAKEKHTRRF